MEIRHFNNSSIISAGALALLNQVKGTGGECWGGTINPDYRPLKIEWSNPQDPDPSLYGECPDIQIQLTLAGLVDEDVVDKVIEDLTFTNLQHNGAFIDEDTLTVTWDLVWTKSGSVGIEI